MSILQPPAIALRSRKDAEEEAEDAPADPADLLPYTPLSVLTTDGMDHEQVWAQLELRADGICKIAKEVGSGDQDDMDAEDEEDDESELEEDDSQEEMTVDEWKQMMADEGYEEGESASEDEDDDEDSEEGSEDDEELGDDDSPELGDEDDEGLSLGSEDEDMEEGEEEDDDEEDDEEGSDAADSDVNPDIDMDGSDDEGFAAGPSKPRKKAKHATLDDEFFSIDDFNRMTEEQEATHVTGGHLGGDDEEEAELDDIGAMFLEEGDEDARESPAV